MTDEALTQIKGVGEKTAVKLQAGGFDTIGKVASASKEDLLKIGLNQAEAKGIIASARSLSGVGKREEARSLSGGEERVEGSFWRFG